MYEAAEQKQQQQHQQQRRRRKQHKPQLKANKQRQEIELNVDNNNNNDNNNNHNNKTMTLPNQTTTSSSTITTTTTPPPISPPISAVVNSSSCGGDIIDDSDMFGPPRSSPPIGYHHHQRSRIPMISPKLRQREERKRILQLCAHKLERIKDSESNLRRSVCINNTWSRLNDEVRREKQMRYLQNLPRTENNPETAREIILSPFDECGGGVGSDNNNKSYEHECDEQQRSHNHNNNHHASNNHHQHHHHHRSICESIENQPHGHNNNSNIKVVYMNHNNNNNYSGSGSTTTQRKRHLSSNNLVNDLEILDRELSAINAPMPLIDPEITQGAEQLEKAISSRKRLRSIEDESDRLVREALSQFYMPPQRLISAIEDCPLDVVGLTGFGNLMSPHHMIGLNGAPLHGNVGQLSGGCSSSSTTNGHNGGGGGTSNASKRSKMNDGMMMDLDFDMNQNQKDFEVIMDALRLGGTPSPTPSMSSSDSCGQAAMMSESASVFHNLVVTSLET